MTIRGPLQNQVIPARGIKTVVVKYPSAEIFEPGSKGWEQIAACRGVDAAIFFPEDENDGAELAKAICGTCSVALSCLEYAISVREKEGIWGGATQRERRSIVRRRRRAAARARAAG